MVDQPLEEADRRLRQLVGVIIQKPEIPRELVQELKAVSLRFSAHVGELRFQKRQLDEAWAELESQ